MALNMPDPNREVGDSGHTSDTNLIIEAVNTLNSAVENIPAGPQGPQGDPGTPGTNGLAATITVANTVTSAPGSNAAVTSSGTPQNVALTFTIPRGETGPAGATGATGGIGPTGATGAAGAPGAGVKPGGLANQVLSKNSDNDFDTAWVFPGSAPVTSVDGRQGAVTLDDLYDELGAAAAAQTAAEDYADGLAVNYDVAGAASAAQTAAEDYADGLSVNYDAAGSAAQALSDAEDYADGLAVNYDPAGSASSAQSAAEDYADGLAINYDPAGSASAVAGDLTDHENATTSVHGISDTSDLVYTNDARLSDARTPTAHATSHETGGTDELELAPAQITGTALVETDLSSSAASTVASTASAGTSTDVSRADHVHDLMYDVPAGAVSFDTTPTGISSAAGKVYWDEDFGTLSITLAGGNVSLPVGQKSGAAVKNKTGSQINKGKVVRFSNASGGNIEVAVATNTGTTNPRVYFGVAAENIANDGVGFAVSSGYIRGLNTNGLTVGALLYIGASGDLTPTKPAKPAFQVPIAVVTFVNSSSGVIYVRVDNGVELNEVFDVDISTPLQGQVLSYNETDEIWENITFTGGATGAGTDAVFYENDQEVTGSYTITTGKNAMSAGPIEIDSGVTVTVPSGSNWVVV